MSAGRYLRRVVGHFPVIGPIFCPHEYYYVLAEHADGTETVQCDTCDTVGTHIPPETPSSPFPGAFRWEDDDQQAGRDLQ